MTLLSVKKAVCKFLNSLLIHNHGKNYQSFSDPFSPKSDLHEISPCNINAL